MKILLRQYGPAVLSGTLLAFSFPGVHAFFLAWLALVPLLRATHGAGVRATAGRFFLAGYLFHAIVLQWLLTHFYWAGGVAFFGHQLLTVYLAAFWAAFGALWAWLTPRLAPVPSSLLLAVLWTSMEFIQGRLFTGFGWSAIGYSQGPDLWFLQNAALGGVTLLSGLVVLVNALLAESLARARLWPIRLAAATLIFLAAHGLGWQLLDTPRYADRPLQVGVLQSNFPQEIKWDPEFSLFTLQMAIDKSLAMLQRADVDLFVWPETLITTELGQNEAFDRLHAFTSSTGAALYSGATRRGEGGSGEFNASVFFNDTGTIVDYYDKIHLAPFGEYVPLARYLPFLRQIVPVGDLLVGEKPKLFEVDGRRFGPLICFEVLFSEMSEHLRREGADFLVVITNLGWFGMSNALPQELEIARMRAVETRLPLVHSANTGISGVFDPWGRFDPVNIHVGLGPNGSYVEISPRVLPEALTMERAVGVFPLPEASVSPLPRGSHWFPRIMLGLTVLTIIVALVRRRPQTP